MFFLIRERNIHVIFIKVELLPSQREGRGSLLYYKWATEPRAGFGLTAPDKECLAATCRKSLNSKGKPPLSQANPGVFYHAGGMYLYQNGNLVMQ